MSELFAWSFQGILVKFSLFIFVFLIFRSTSYVCPPLLPSYNTIAQPTIFPAPISTKQLNYSPEIEALLHPSAFQTPFGCYSTYSSSSVPLTTNTPCYSGPVLYPNSQSNTKLSVTSATNGNHRTSPPQIAQQNFVSLTWMKISNISSSLTLIWIARIVNKRKKITSAQIKVS